MAAVRNGIDANLNLRAGAYRPVEAVYTRMDQRILESAIGKLLRDWQRDTCGFSVAQHF